MQVTVDAGALAAAAGTLISVSLAVGLWVGFKWGERATIRGVKDEVADAFVALDQERQGKRRKLRLR